MPSYVILYLLPDPLRPYLDLILAEFETIPSNSGISLLLVGYLAPLFLLFPYLLTLDTIYSLPHQHSRNRRYKIGNS